MSKCRPWLFEESMSDGMVENTFLIDAKFQDRAGKGRKVKKEICQRTLTILLFFKRILRFGNFEAKLAVHCNQPTQQNYVAGLIFAATDGKKMEDTFIFNINLPAFMRGKAEAMQTARKKKMPLTATNV